MELDKEQECVRTYLIAIARQRKVISYSELCLQLSLPYDMGNEYHRGLIGHLLGQISRAEHEAGRPMLSSVVITRRGAQILGPGGGFYGLAEEELGFRSDIRKMGKYEFWLSMLRKTHDYWAEK